MTTDNFLTNISFNSDGTTRFNFIYPPTQAGTTFAAPERTTGELMNKSDEYKCKKPYNRMFLNGGSVVFEFVRPGSCLPTALTKRRFSAKTIHSHSNRAFQSV